MGDTIQILWTGGWDSTYRMVELARQQVTVEPVYVINSGRRSAGLEQAAMDRILGILRDSDRFPARILPLVKIRREDIPDNDRITDAFNRLAADYPLGPQYEWLGRLAVTKPGIEICIEKAEPGVLHSRDVIERGGPEADALFSNFSLPLYDITEAEMLANIKSWGCMDVMKHIWFCNHPLKNGEPCGLCNPCRIKARPEMNFLLPEGALERNRKMMEMEEEEARDYRYNLWSEQGIPLE